MNNAQADRRPAPAPSRLVSLFTDLQIINARPTPWSRPATDALWTDPHISKMMLKAHLDGSIDLASRRTDVLEASVAWIGETFGLVRGTRVLDLGCGPGLYANRLARTGASVTGIDFSGRSIRHARAVANREGLPVSYVNENYLAYETDERFELIIMVFCDYGALDPDQRRQLLGKVAGWLAPGGSFLFDVHSLAAYETRGEAASYGPSHMARFWSPRPYFGFHNTFKYDEAALTLDRYEIVEADRTRTYYNWHQYFDHDTLAGELRRSGFDVLAFMADVAGGGFDPSSPEFAAAARIGSRR